MLAGVGKFMACKRSTRSSQSCKNRSHQHPSSNNSTSAIAVFGGAGRAAGQSGTFVSGDWTWIGASLQIVMQYVVPIIRGLIISVQESSSTSGRISPSLRCERGMRGPNPEREKQFAPRQTANPSCRVPTKRCSLQKGPLGTLTCCYCKSMQRIRSKHLQQVGVHSVSGKGP